MRGFIDKLKGVRTSTLVLSSLALFALALYFIAAFANPFEALQPGPLAFQSERDDFTFAPGEVKIADADVENLVFAAAHLEGRISSNPVRVGDTVEFSALFPTTGGRDVETTVVLPAEGENARVGLIVAEKGAIGIEVTRRLAPVSELIPLVEKGEPIQVVLYVQEMTDELRERVMADPLCGENADFCRASLDELQRWYANNTELVEAVRNDGTLPNNHRVGAVQQLVVFDDE